jgi:non-specific serine/threonine protein kinase
LPFFGRTAPVVYKEILTKDPIPPEQLKEGIPSELSSMILKLLEKNRDLRYQSAAELRADLRRFRRDLESGKSFPSASVSLGPPVSKEKKRFPILVPLILLVVLVAIVLGVFLQTGVFMSETQRSVAVLPFDVLGDDRSTQELSDGLTSAIVIKLSRIGELAVTSRSSSMRYQNSTKSLAEIGRELKVANLLDGTIQRQGDRVQISAQLVDAQSDKTLWAESYDREVADLLAVQDDIAQEIAAALEVAFQVGKAEAGEGVSLTAHDYFVLGKGYYRMGLMDEAEAHLRRLKELETDQSFSPELILARIYEAKEDYQAAVEELDEFLELNPDTEDQVPMWRDALLARLSREQKRSD